MPVGAYYAIHYGKEYLEHSLRSVLPAVDMVGIFYSAQPSHGYRDPRLRNPDSVQDIKAAIARAGWPDKIHWVEGNWFNEGQHRDHAVMTMQQWGCDPIVVVDSDEVWDTDGLREMLNATKDMEAGHIALNLVHFWRSFVWVCRDEMMPIRIVKRGQPGPAYYRMAIPIYHFGYAQRPEMVRYKATIHGHRGEWRTGWFDRKFSPWSPYPIDGARIGDVHPTCGGIWYPEQFDRLQLPWIMRNHPYWDVEIIR